MKDHRPRSLSTGYLLPRRTESERESERKRVRESEREKVKEVGVLWKGNDRVKVGFG